MEELDSYNSGINKKILIELVTTLMPYGKYKGLPLYRLPEPYLVWLSRNGFPNGKLGMMLGTLYEIKLNGLEYLLTPLIKQKTS